MAGRGPAPKDPSERSRRNLDYPDVVELSDDGGVKGWPLPDGEWHARTVAWWETWRRSPQAQTFTETDWSFLLDTALMHDAMWSKGQWTLAAEVRLRVAKFGATPEDRARLKIAVVPAKQVEGQQRRTRSSAARRERVLRAVSDDA